MKKKKIIVIGCCGMPEELIEAFKCIQHEPMPIFIDHNKSKEVNYKDIQELYLHKSKEVFQLETVLDERLHYKIEEEELYNDPIIHGYQNPRNTIMLSSRGKFRRKSHKKRKRR